MEEIKILTIENLTEILDFEKARLPGEGIEKEMLAWHAPWRQEALEHYLPKGWSFVKRVDGQIIGYVLCQPLLFFQGWTQSLWIEHVAATNPEIGTEMLEMAYRWARDKHLQKVFFNTELEFIKDVQFAKTQGTSLLANWSSTKL